METNIPELDSKGLRKFGMTAAGGIVILFGLVLPWVYDRSSSLWIWIIAAVLVAWSIILPAGLRPVYRGWMRLALILGKVNAMLLLSIVFFFIITPAGVAIRLFGHDPLQRRFDPSARSYRKSSIPRKPDTMEKLY